jgi:serine/threonine protein kinase
VYEYYRDELNVYIVIELCTGNDLFEKFMSVSSLDEYTVSTLVKQMVEALNCCQEKGNFRKVLRPESFKFESKEENAKLKLVDLDLSRLLEDKGNTSHKQ